LIVAVCSSLYHPVIGTAEAQTAILFFSHRPEREWQNKWFVRHDYAKNRQVAEAFYKHARQAVEQSSFPVLEVNGAQQRGARFGSRLANAFADAFVEGYEHVIAVGSDCPRLHEVDWPAVARRLESGRPVLGPTSDEEGTYLIGLTREQFQKGSFAALPWKTSELLSTLRRYLEEDIGAEPFLLAARGDVNGHGELVSLLRTRAARLPRSLLTRLRLALGLGEHSEGGTRSLGKHPVSNARPRAPPSFSSRLSSRGSVVSA